MKWTSDEIRLRVSDEWLGSWPFRHLVSRTYNLNTFGVGHGPRIFGNRLLVSYCGRLWVVGEMTSHFGHNCSIWPFNLVSLFAVPTYLVAKHVARFILAFVDKILYEYPHPDDADLYGVGRAYRLTPRGAMVRYRRVWWAAHCEDDPLHYVTPRIAPPYPQLNRRPRVVS